MHSNQTVASKNSSFLQSPDKSIAQKIARAMVIKQFSKLTKGQLLVQEKDANYIFGHKDNSFPITANIKNKNYKYFFRIMSSDRQAGIILQAQVPS